MIDKKPVDKQLIAQDHHRPQFHYAPAQNWMNDPNGVIQWGGRYHLFYQYNPYGANHANMHWGHAVSDNLTHWEELPVAIAPSDADHDCGGIFSGCMVDDNGTPRAIYTGVNADNSIQTQCIANGSSDLITWDYDVNNPVISKLPPEVGQTADFRDPYVWQANDKTWYMAVGSRIEGVGGTVLLYQSDNLTDWTYLNPLFVSGSALHGVMFECPNFFPLGDKWVMIISSHIGYGTGTVLYWVGDFIDHKFIPETEGILDSGYYYAPLTHLDDQNRRIMWAWVREGREEANFVNTGWSGVQAFPRVLTLDDHNRLLMTPAEELVTLRTVSKYDETSDLTRPLVQDGFTFEIKATFNIADDANYGFNVLSTPDGAEKITIYYDRLTETLRIHRIYAESNTGNEAYAQGIPHTLDNNEDLELHILIDGSTIEVIANQRASVTSRFYPQHIDNPTVHVLSPSNITSLNIWDMASIW